MTVETLLRQVGREGLELLPADADEQQWLALRNSGVGASEVAAVLGESAYDSPYSLWARKTGRVEPDQAGRTAAQTRGLRMEPVIADTFADHHPEYRVENVGLVRHREHEWEIATPDRLLVSLAEHAGLLEIKTAGFGQHTEWGEEGTDEIPVAYLTQCQWQLAVTGLPFCHVAVMFTLDDYREYLVRRDEDVIAYLRSEVHRFWHDHVLPDVAPLVDGHDATTRALRTLPAREAVEVGPRLIELREQYQAAKTNADRYTQEAQAAANEARELLAGAQVGTCDGQTVVTNKYQHGRASFDTERFTRDYPDLAAQYMIRGADYPTLRWKKA